MTGKEKHDFIDHVVHLTLFAEDRLLSEHGGEYSVMEEDGIDSNEYYRIITERVISILKKNKNYMQEEPVSEDLEEAAKEIVAAEDYCYVDENNMPLYDSAYLEYMFKEGAKWKEEQIEEVLLSEVLPCFMHGGEADEVMAKLDEVLNKKK